MTWTLVLNMIVMAMDRYGIDEEEEATLNQLNRIFTFIYIFEMACKLISFGPKKYASDVLNLADGAVVVLEVIGMISFYGLV